MGTIVLTLVAACCAYAVFVSWRHWRDTVVVSQLDSALTLRRLRRLGASAVDDLSLPDSLKLSLRQALLAEPRRAVALSNALLLEVSVMLERGAPSGKLSWRICCAASVAGLLFVVWSQRTTALVIAALGAGAALACLLFGRSADLRSRAARGAWNELARGLTDQAVRSDGDLRAGRS